jgi:actin-like ATPase involved in cell morphogenesis
MVRPRIIIGIPSEVTQVEKRLARSPTRDVFPTPIGPSIAM